MTSWDELIRSGRPIVADGAMGTMLMANGLEFGDPPELWNLEHPEIIRRVQRGYLEAGAQVLLTNTFGGNRLRLELHGRQDRVDQLNRTAAVLARVEADAADHPVVVAGDLGPTRPDHGIHRRHAHARDRPRGLRRAGARARGRRRGRHVGRDDERRRRGRRGDPGREGRSSRPAGHRDHELRHAWPDDDGRHPGASRSRAARGRRSRNRRQLRQRARGARAGDRADAGCLPGRGPRGQGQRGHAAARRHGGRVRDDARDDGRVRHAASGTPGRTSSERAAAARQPHLRAMAEALA